MFAAFPLLGLTPCIGRSCLSVLTGAALALGGVAVCGTGLAADANFATVLGLALAVRAGGDFRAAAFVAEDLVVPLTGLAFALVVAFVAAFVVFLLNLATDARTPFAQ